MSSPLPAVAAALLFACSAIAAEEVVSTPQAQHATTTRLLPKLPKYNPPKAGSTVDQREIDRPRNTIVRLPKDLLPPDTLPAPASSSESHEPAPEGVLRLPRYDVREHRLPNFKERELYSPTARIDLYLKRHPGLRIGNLFGLNRGIAAAMIADEDDRDRRLEMADLLAFQAFAESQPRPKADGDLDESGDTSTPPARGK